MKRMYRCTVQTCTAHILKTLKSQNQSVIDGGASLMPGRRKSRSFLEEDNFIPESQ